MVEFFCLFSPPSSLRWTVSISQTCDDPGLWARSKFSRYRSPDLTKHWELAWTEQFTAATLASLLFPNARPANLQSRKYLLWCGFSSEVKGEASIGEVVCRWEWALIFWWLGSVLLGSSTAPPHTPWGFEVKEYALSELLIFLRVAGHRLK